MPMPLPAPVTTAVFDFFIGRPSIAAIKVT
jgi:hypothetical protein